MDISVPIEVLSDCFRTYFPSLKPYAQYYRPILQIQDEEKEYFAYLCPLCLRTGIFVIKEKGMFALSPFSMDHFPPESVEGKRKMLVCKDCNSDAGAAYDHVFAQKIQYLSFQNNVHNAAIPAKSVISTVKGRYPLVLVRNKNGEIEMNFKPSPNAHTPLLDQFLEGPVRTNDYNISMSVQSPDDAKVSKALLKAAYLSCFAVWGYEFVFSFTGRAMRECLQGNRAYPLPVPSFWMGKIVDTAEIEYFPLFLCTIQHPLTWRSFIVNLRIVDVKTGYREIAGVLIPGPDEADWLHLQKTEEIISVSAQPGAPSVDVSLRHVPEEQSIFSRFDGYATAWRELKTSI